MGSLKPTTHERHPSQGGIDNPLLLSHGVRINSLVCGIVLGLPQYLGSANGIAGLQYLHVIGMRPDPGLMLIEPAFRTLFQREISAKAALVVWRAEQHHHIRAYPTVFLAILS